MKIGLKDPVNFNELVIRKGFSKRGLAEAAKIGQVTVLKICNGDRRPSPKIAQRIKEALDMEWDDLFIIEKEPKAATH